MIVIDAAAALSGLLRTGPARSRLAEESLSAPHLLDTEIADVLCGLVHRKALDLTLAGRTLATWKTFGVRRYPTMGLVDRIWELRHNVSAYDAAYVALAEALDCRLVTADQRLASTDGLRCTIDIVPR